MAGFTQEEVAERLMQPLSFVAKYATGERRIDVVELLQITDALRIGYVCDSASDEENPARLLSQNSAAASSAW
jgi:transcriptional regulator with XRE-family HTH domain